MFVPFVYELRSRGVPVGAQEAVALGEALNKGLHDSTLTGFYHTARCLLVHNESHLDIFDQAFLAHFHGVETAAAQLHQDLLDWLREAVERRPHLSPEERALLEGLDYEELKKMLEERLREQKERHDGGNRWIGTGGSSPFGHSGLPVPGFRIGGPGGNRRAMQVAEARSYGEYRNDRRLDVRQFSVALRKLRSFAREGTEQELDLEESIRETARNAGELEIVTRPPRRPNTRVVLLMDVGGSMDPYTRQVEQLFTAASKATHFKEFRSYYFHNCVYESVYGTADFRDPYPVEQLLHTSSKETKLVIVGDAMMAPYELVAPKHSFFFGWEGQTTGLEWLMKLKDHFAKCAWINPEQPKYWSGETLNRIRTLFPMFCLTLEGLGLAVDHLTGRRRGDGW